MRHFAAHLSGRVTLFALSSGLAWSACRSEQQAEPVEPVVREITDVGGATTDTGPRGPGTVVPTHVTSTIAGGEAESDSYRMRFTLSTPLRPDRAEGEAGTIVVPLLAAPGLQADSPPEAAPGIVSEGQ